MAHSSGDCKVRGKAQSMQQLAYMPTTKAANPRAWDGYNSKRGPQPIYPSPASELVA